MHVIYIIDRVFKKKKNWELNMIMFAKMQKFFFCILIVSCDDDLCTMGRLLMVKSVNTAFRVGLATWPLCKIPKWLKCVFFLAQIVGILNG